MVLQKADFCYLYLQKKLCIAHVWKPGILGDKSKTLTFWKQRIPLANRKAYRRSRNAEEKYLDIYLELAERVAVFVLGTFKPS